MTRVGKCTRLPQKIPCISESCVHYYWVAGYIQYELHVQVTVSGSLMFTVYMYRAIASKLEVDRLGSS